MTSGGGGSAEREAAHRRAFRLVQDIQAGVGGAADELERLGEVATRRGWPEVFRVCLFGASVRAWIGHDDELGTALAAFIERCDDDGDDALLSAGLAMRSTLWPTDAADAELARATVLAERAPGGAMELVSAHTACGIGFGTRWLWELSDEEYAAALGLAGELPPEILDVLISPVVYNRLEAQVSWASALRQVGDEEGVRERLRAWQDLEPSVEAAGLPAAWRDELGILGLLVASIAGEDRSAEARKLVAAPATNPTPRLTGHLWLAAALGDAGAGRDTATDATEAAVKDLNPIAYPHEYELALHLGAEIEAAGGHGAGLRAARRQVEQRWANRAATLRAMRGLIEAERLSTEHESLRQAAHLDDLTGVGNRRALGRYISAASQRAIRRISLAILDIDEFKSVNDRYGHAAGDAALIGVARILDESVRPDDLVVRLGGDEFAVVLADVDLPVARRRLRAVMERVSAQRWDEVAPGVHLTLSVGLSSGLPEHIDELRSRADAALYEAKAAGGRTIVSRTAGALPGT